MELRWQQSCRLPTLSTKLKMIGSLKPPRKLDWWNPPTLWVAESPFGGWENTYLWVVADIFPSFAWGLEFISCWKRSAYFWQGGVTYKVGWSHLDRFHLFANPPAGSLCPHGFCARKWWHQTKYNLFFATSIEGNWHYQLQPNWYWSNFCFGVSKSIVKCCLM